MKPVSPLIALMLMSLLITGCTKEKDSINQKPTLAFSGVADGLKLTLTGTSSDKNGKVIKLKIDWNDAHTDVFENNDFSHFNISHAYLNPGNYQPIVTVFNISGDSAFLMKDFAVDFHETSLAGIKETLFKASADEYLILTVNLHTYQESSQNEKFQLITDLIGKMDVDFVLFQECAQHKSSAIAHGIIRVDNMAKVISDRVKQSYGIDYQYVWDWSHYGWEVWEEGLAVMTRYPIVASDSRYISVSTSKNSITSRKTVYATCQLSDRQINLFSVHTHWRTSLTDEEQNQQISRLKEMVVEKEAAFGGAGSLVAGDFNGNPTSEFPWSEGYHGMMNGNEYTDALLNVYPEANNIPPLSAYYTIGGTLPGRIDYVFVKNSLNASVMDTQIIFTDDVIGRVSDHFGVLTKIRLN
ncbi:MAG: endonuclease/exonuclease/phosphatase family protein [Bacteroidales bacterium]|nr:endonuclease/exonuclease/phosphatase family protein [Bacteroidales bacterium]